MADQQGKAKSRSRWWNGCFLVLAFGWGLLLNVGFATTFDGPVWDRFGPEGWDNGPAVAFFVGIGILYGIKRGAEALWDHLGKEDDMYPPRDAPGSDQ